MGCPSTTPESYHKINIMHFLCTYELIRFGDQCCQNSSFTVLLPRCLVENANYESSFFLGLHFEMPKCLTIALD